MNNRDSELIAALGVHVHEHPEVEVPQFVPADIEGIAHDAERVDEYSRSGKQIAEVERELSWHGHSGGGEEPLGTVGL